MAQAYTRGDSLGVYETVNNSNVVGLGGFRGAGQVTNLGFLTDTPIPQIVITGISSYNGTGIGELSVDGTNALTWTPPSGTPTTPVTIAANQSKLIESSSPSKWIRVFWDGDYSTDNLGGGDDLTLYESEVDASGSAAGTTYIGLMLTNHSALAQDITAVKAWIATIATQRTTGTAQLSSSGAGTITTATTNGFADWPSAGWAHIKTSGGTTREIVYYTSRTATSLTVPSGGRGLLGTSTAAGSATDTVDAIPGCCIGKETADSDNRIQVIANATTAPTGVTWNTGTTSASGLSIGTLVSNQNAGLWLKFDIPAVAVASMVNQLNIILEFTVGGATYNNAIMYNMRIKDTTMNRYELYAGIDANPNLDGAASTTSATLPFTYALSTPVSGTREHRITVRKRNSLGLTSLNNFYRSFIVDNTGALVGSEISAPQDISVENVGDKSLRIRASYSAALDDDPADTFIIYATDDGVDPDPTVDTPITIGTVGDADIITGKSYISFVLDSATYGLEWNTTIKVIVRMLRSGDSVESDNLDIVTTVIDSGEPAVIANGQDVLISTTTHNASPACVTYSLYGQTYTLLSSTLLWRAIVGDKESGRLFINNALALANATISGSGTGDIEVVDANTLYLNVGGTRRAKVDLSANTISAATIVYNGVIDDNVSVGPLSTDNGKLYLSVYNPSRQLWQPFLQLDSSGVLTFGFPIIQKDT